MELLQFTRSLYRSFVLALLAADESAAGRWTPARQLLAQAETQYAGALKTLLASCGLTLEQTEELRRELADLSDTLAALNRRINRQFATLLVVNDDKVLPLAFDALQAEGHAILTAESFERAFEISRAYRPEIHLALTALRSNEGMTSLQFCDRIALERPGIVAALISRNGESCPIPGHIPIPSHIAVIESFSVSHFRRRVRQLLGFEERLKAAPHNLSCIDPRGMRRNALGTGGVMYDPELLRKEMIAVGERLLQALRLEERASTGPLHGPNEDRLLQEWQQARKTVESMQRAYDEAIERYRNALHDTYGEFNPRVSRKTILLLEDDTNIRTLLTRMLERSGCTVLQASGGNDAAAISENHRGPIDLMIADVILSDGAHGIETAHRLIQLRPDVPVLFISGYPEEQLENRGILNPAVFPFRKTAFLQKPFTRAALEGRMWDLI